MNPRNSKRDERFLGLGIAVSLISVLVGFPLLVELDSHAAQAIATVVLLAIPALLAARLYRGQ